MAVTFDGTDDALVVPHDGSIDFADEDFSVGCWFRTDGLVNWFAYMCSKNYGGGGVKWYGMTVRDGGRVWCFIDDGTNSVEPDITGNYVDGNWHHALLVRDTTANLVHVYVDGDGEHAQAADTAGSIANASDLTIGARADFSAIRYFPGDLADLCIIRRALTAAEAVEIGKSKRRLPLRFFDGDLALYLPLMGPTGSTVNTAHWGSKDLSGNGNSVSSVNSAPTWADDPLAPPSWTEGLFGGAWAEAAAANVMPVMDYYYRRRRTA